MYLLKCFSSVFWQEKEFEAIVVCEYVCSILDREVGGLKYFSGSQSFPSY